MIKIIDDFFPNPYEIRSEGIKCDSYKISSSYPGKRHAISDQTKNFIEKKLEKELGMNLQIQDCGFDFITKEYVTGTPHSDRSNSDKQNFCDYSAVVYLNPDPPSNSGIELYGYAYKNRHLYFHTKNANKLKEGFFSSSKNLFDRFIWKNIIIPRCMRGLTHRVEVANKFNRMIVFDSDLIHRPQDYFGDKKENCRMSIISFLKKC